MTVELNHCGLYKADKGYYLEFSLAPVPSRRIIRLKVSLAHTQ